MWDTGANQAVPIDHRGRDRPRSRVRSTANGEACRTAFDHLARRGGQVHAGVHAPRSPASTPRSSRTFALEYIKAQPAGIRMGQGMQRVYNSHSPFRTVATLAAVAGYIGVRGRRRVARGRHGVHPLHPRRSPSPRSTTRTGRTRARTRRTWCKSSTHLRRRSSPSSPIRIDFLWFANSNFINMSPDANRIINEVLPSISTIVTVDPYWTWTAKYSDYVLPACNYWEKWDFLDRSPWVFFEQPCRRRRRARASPTWRSCRFWPSKVGLERLVEQDRRGMGAQLRERRASRLGRASTSTRPWQEGIWGAPRRHLRLRRSSSPTACSPRPPRSSSFYNDDLVPFEEEVPCYKPMLEDPKGPAGAEVPARVPAVPRPPERAHAAHPAYPALTAVQDEPLLRDEPGGRQGARHRRRRCGAHRERSRRMQDAARSSPRASCPARWPPRAAGRPTTPSRATIRCSPT